MFKIYSTYYGGGNLSAFNNDLDSKSFVVLLTDSEKSIRGFSTLVVYDETFKNEPLKVLYSGDTIIEKDYWGKNDFAMSWLRLAGSIKKKFPNIPLYWLLIVKGHRTYRYLSLFSKEYYPRHNVKTPAGQQDLMNHLAQSKFGDSFHPESGLVKFSGPRSFLNEDLVSIPEKDQRRPDVQFFLSRNPEYYKGDELLCLCELKQDNLTRFSRKWFMEGMCK